MTAVDPALRLSAVRALLGAIYPEVRLVKVRRDGDRIIFTAVCDDPVSARSFEAPAVAAGEVIADFPTCDLNEHIVGSNDPLPAEDVLTCGWVFRRAEH